MKLLKQLSLKEWLSTLIIASAAFFAVGNNYYSLEQFLFHPHDRGEWLGLYNSQF